MGIILNNVIIAFSLTLIAGLSTAIGGFISLFSKPKNSKFLSISLGFSAGVMVYVSMVEILSKSTMLFSETYGEKSGFLFATISFFAGMILICAIDSFIPNKPLQEKESKTAGRLLRTGIVTALAISIHNFPEGLATFVSALREPELALPIVAAIAIHNVPEGIAVAVPVYTATGSKKRAFITSLLSGLTEPLGAFVGYLLLMPFMSDLLYAILFGGIAGIMVFISLDELFPASMECGDTKLSVFGVIGGMAVMAVSLWMFK